MNENNVTPLESLLNNFTGEQWFQAADELAADIHPVDRNAVRIWLRFFPLELHRYLQAAENKEEAMQKFAMFGQVELKDQIDSSHRFLYGHRYWKTVKETIESSLNASPAQDDDLKDITLSVAERVADKVKADRALVIGITIAGLMTLVQVGSESFRSASGDVQMPAGIMAKSPDAIVSERARDDSQGILGFLKTVDKKFTVNYISPDGTGKFKVINEEEIASAAARDQSQNWSAQDSRCLEGVIPVECRSAACGTCWVGVLSGEEKLSDVETRERRQVKVFGYKQPEDAKPYLRLACQAKAYGNATIVIPPWNGVFGKKVYGNVEERELEPATTSARQNRQVVREAVDVEN